MSDTTEKLKDLKAEREARIKANNNHIEGLIGENEQLEGEIRGLAMAIKLCLKDEPDEEQETPALIGKYATMGLTDAILDIIDVRGGAPGLTGNEIVKILESEGFKSKARELYNSVYGVAMGLLDQGRIKEGKKDGKRTFMRKTA